MYSDMGTYFLLMGLFFVSLIVQTVFIVQKLLGVITWEWWRVLCILEFYGAAWLLGVVVVSCFYLVVTVMRLK